MKRPRSRDEEVEVIIETCLRHYNAVSPHFSLDYQTPNVFDAELAHPAQMTTNLYL